MLVSYSLLSKGFSFKAAFNWPLRLLLTKEEGMHFIIVYLEQTRVFQAGVSPLNLNSMGQTSINRMVKFQFRQLSLGCFRGLG